MLPVEQPFKTYTGLDGKPLDNGYVYFGQPHEDPITKPVTVYWDAAGTKPAFQPLRTVNGYIMNNGTPANVFFDGAYSELVLDKKRQQVFYARTSEEFSISALVLSLAKAFGSSLIGFIQAGVGAVARTVQDELRERVSVKQFGAKGDGVTDDTAAIQAALNTGSDVRIPAGTYIVDPEVSLLPLSNQKITLAKRAVLKAKANSASIYHVIKVIDKENVVVEGGRIIGDRATHVGAIGESGMGISVYNSTNVTIRDVMARDCWGDGFYVGGTGLTGQSANVNLIDCVSDNNRRQGLSIAAVAGCRVRGGRYVNTNGIAPAAGIDVEPNPGKGTVTDVVIEGVTASGNAGCGITVSQTITKGVKLLNNTVEENGLSGIQCGYVGGGLIVQGNFANRNSAHGIYIFGDAAYVTRDLSVRGNVVNDNGQCGVYMFKNVRRFDVLDNRCYGNGTYGVRLDGTGGYPVDDGVVRGNICESNSQSAHNTYDNICVDAYTHQINVAGNICRKGALANKPKYGLNVTANEQHIIALNDLYTGGETANYNGVLANVSLRGNIGFKTENSVLSNTFAVDVATNVIVAIPHGCGYTPATHHCQLSFVDTTAYDFDAMPKIQSVDAVNVTVRVKIAAAAGAGSVARLALLVRRP